MMLLFLSVKGCNPSKYLGSNTVSKSDTTYYNHVDTTVITHFKHDTTEVPVRIRIAQYDTIIKPVHIDFSGDTKNNRGWTYHYSGTITEGTDTVMYTFSITDDQLTDIGFDISSLATVIDSSRTDTILIEKTDSVTITITETTTNKPKIAPVVGGAIGYNHSLKLPSISILGGIKDKRERMWFLRGEILSQSVEVGVLIPITTKRNANRNKL